VSGQQQGQDDTWTEISYLIAVIIGVLALERLWSVKLRPWVDATWTDLKAGEVAELPVLGAVDTIDLVGMGVLIVPFLVLVVVLVAMVRKRRARAKAASAAR
jgi:hypothetical protein